MANTEPQERDESVKGYTYKFIDMLPDDMICLICRLPACNPHQRDCCGKVFCKACLAEYQKHSSQCPNCRQEGQNFFDRRTDRQIKSLRMSCENEEKGCTWTGELFDLEPHFKNCPCAEVSCPNQCSEQVMRKDLESHLLSDCPLREHTCPTCNQTGPYQTMTSTHKELCPEIVVSCPNECGITNMARKYLLEHRGGCPLEKVVCGFPGCESQLRRDELKRHDEDYQLQHLQLLKTAFKTILQNQKDILAMLQSLSTSGQGQ